MKVFIDSNIWLRFILADQKKAYLQCRSFLEMVELGKLKPYTSFLVLLEVYYVLTAIYKIKQKLVCQDLLTILSTRNLVLLETTFFKKALALHQKTAIKLADCLIASQIPLNAVLVTYDADFKKIKELSVKSPEEFSITQ